MPPLPHLLGVSSHVATDIHLGQDANNAAAHVKDGDAVGEQLVPFGEAVPDETEQGVIQRTSYLEFHIMTCSQCQSNVTEQSGQIC